MHSFMCSIAPHIKIIIKERRRRKREKDIDGVINGEDIMRLSESLLKSLMWEGNCDPSSRYAWTDNNLETLIGELRCEFSIYTYVYYLMPNYWVNLPK